jgi:glycerol transport system ATP-binding protein
MLGGNVVVLDEGRILQTGPTPDVYHNPATTKVAEVFSDPPINFINGVVQDGNARLGDNIEFSLIAHLQTLSAGHYIFGVRSNHLFLDRTHEQDVEFHTTVELSEINGSETFIHVHYNNSRVVVQENGVHPYRMGTEISIYVSPSSFFVFDQAGELVASPSREDSDR